MYSKAYTRFNTSLFDTTTSSLTFSPFPGDWFMVFACFGGSTMETIFKIFTAGKVRVSQAISSYTVTFLKSFDHNSFELYTILKSIEKRLTDRTFVNIILNEYFDKVNPELVDCKFFDIWRIKSTTTYSLYYYILLVFRPITGANSSNYILLVWNKFSIYINYDTYKLQR